jgi:hypothetical protein
MASTTASSQDHGLDGRHRISPRLIYERDSLFRNFALSRRIKAKLVVQRKPAISYWHALYTRACQPGRASGFSDSASAQSSG